MRRLELIIKDKNIFNGPGISDRLLGFYPQNRTILQNVPHLREDGLRRSSTSVFVTVS